jgi:hypothetical protein
VPRHALHGLKRQESLTFSFSRRDTLPRAGSPDPASSTRRRNSTAAEPDYVALTVRRLNPGAYHTWRKAWHDLDDPDALWPEHEPKAYILRNVDDPDEIVAYGTVKLHELLSLRDDPQTQRKQEKRSAAGAPHVPKPS